MPATVFENFHVPSGQPAHPGWVSEAAKDAYPTEAAFSSPINFAKDNWKEIAGVGALVGAGIFIATREGSLGTLTNLLKGGEAGVLAEESGSLANISPALIERIRGVDHFVFDLDRTLVNTDKAVPALRQTMEAELVKQTGLSEGFIKDALDQTTQRLDSPYFWNRLDEIRPLQEQFPGVNLNERFASVSQASKAAFYGGLETKPEAVELLQYLKDQGKSVHIFTASSPARALEKLNGAGLTGYFDTIYTSGVNSFEDTATSGLLTKESSARIVALPQDAKTDGMGYQMIVDRLGSNPQRLAMTGDHPIQDVANAQSLGILAARAKWFADVPAQNVLPDLELTSPSQLTELLKRAYTSVAPS